MTVAQRSVVVAIFEDAAHAEHAIRDLLNAGFKAEDLGCAVRAPSAESESTIPPDATGVGAMVGGYSGVVLGGLLGVAISTIIPGIGPVLAAGTVALLLGGAYVGGLVGMLVGMGISEDEAKEYHRHVEEGRALVAVKTVDRYSEALGILSATGALDTMREAEQTTAPREQVPAGT